MAIAIFAKTATKGTTIIPVLSSEQISKKLYVVFPFCIVNGGKINDGIPETTFPDNSKGISVSTELQLNAIIDAIKTTIAFLAILMYQISFLKNLPVFVVIGIGRSFIC